MSEEPESLFVSVDQASKLLGIGRSLLYELMTRGEIPYRQFGTRRVIPRAWIIQQATECLNPPAPTPRLVGRRRAG